MCTYSNWWEIKYKYATLIISIWANDRDGANIIYRSGKKYILYIDLFSKFACQL